MPDSIEDLQIGLEQKIEPRNEDVKKLLDERLKNLVERKPFMRIDSGYCSSDCWFSGSAENNQNQIWQELNKPLLRVVINIIGGYLGGDIEKNFQKTGKAQALLSSLFFNQVKRAVSIDEEKVSGIEPETPAFSR